MAEMDIGYFGDRRLKKMARGCWVVCVSARRFVCAGLGTTEPKR